MHVAILRQCPGVRDVNCEYAEALISALPDTKRVLEIGPGFNAATVLLPEDCEPERYTIIEPGLPCGSHYQSGLRSGSWLEHLSVDFFDWTPAATYDLAISKLVAHHFPERLDEWYRQAARALHKGGLFIQCDHAFHEEFSDAERFMGDMINAAFTPYPRTNDPARMSWAQHVRKDLQDLRPLEEHMGHLVNNGFIIEDYCVAAGQFFVRSRKA